MIKLIVVSIVAGYLLKLVKTTPVVLNPSKWNEGDWFDYSWITILIFFVLAAASGNF